MVRWFGMDWAKLNKRRPHSSKENWEQGNTRKKNNKKAVKYYEKAGSWIVNGVGIAAGQSRGPEMVYGFAQSAGTSQSRQEAGHARFHGLGLVRLVHQAQ